MRFYEHLRYQLYGLDVLSNLQILKMQHPHFCAEATYRQGYKAYHNCVVVAETLA